MALPLAETEGCRIRVRGLVQGVGFRPHVWRLARDAGLAGQVRNDGEGVEIEAWGAAAALAGFLDALKTEAPPLARVDAVEAEALPGRPPAGGFSIAESGQGAVNTGIVPDAATCPACLAEVLDPADRHHGYAFTNCTHCGPRLSIVREIPYDRATTSMSVFAMCPACRREYEDPADRRFHAQPNACPDCGPRLWLEAEDGRQAVADPLGEAARLIKEGAIVAVKGIGGFHLACDALNADAVAALRNRKRRYAKPFAVMARDLAMVRRFARVSNAEADLLESPAAPIVLLRAEGEPLAEGVAPGQDSLGVMLPYTPLHHLLLRAVEGPIVLTSGNRSDEPQVTDNAEACVRLAGIAEAWLMHDRAIVNRLDDSVVRLDAPGPAVLRRARGMAPAPFNLAAPFNQAPRVLALGGELKATFCLLRQGQAVVSQHIGDLEEVATHADYRAMLALYRQIYDFDPEVIAVDKHPDYLSTQWGAALAAETGARLVEVQHHHAHLAACLAEHGLAAGEEEALGLILDGLGFGADGTIWGGEFLAGGYESFERLGHFLPVAMPGGAKASREPWRNTFAHLRAAGIIDRMETAGLAGKPLETLDRMIAQGLNAPPASSAGRLFDAVAGALGLCRDGQSHEAQAAMELEALARPFMAEERPYPVALLSEERLVLAWQPLWAALLDDLTRHETTGRIAARFHRGLIDTLARAATTLAGARGLRRVVLSGGVMQNQLLLEGLHRELRAAGFEVLSPHRMPANDGGLSLGQAIIAALR